MTAKGAAVTQKKKAVTPKKKAVKKQMVKVRTPCKVTPIKKKSICDMSRHREKVPRLVMEKSLEHFSPEDADRIRTEATGLKDPYPTCNCEGGEENGPFYTQLGAA